MMRSSLPPLLYQVVCERILVLFVLFALLWFHTRLDYMSNMAGVSQEAGTMRASGFL
jgi:hypothetical protein